MEAAPLAEVQAALGKAQTKIDALLKRVDELEKRDREKTRQIAALRAGAD